MYIKRSIENILAKARTFPAIILTGPRQSGKTTLLKHFLGKKYNYVLLDSFENRSLAQGDPKRFLEKFKPPLIIDEIQNAPGLLSEIKDAMEKNRAPAQWVMTGSQQFSLMKNVSESLAGRAAILHLHPFSIAESLPKEVPALLDIDTYMKTLLTPKNLKVSKSLDLGTLLLEGFYPEIRTDPSVATSLWYSSYWQTYIDRDVRGNIKEANLYEFERFIKLLAARTATELNLAGLSREIGISIPTVKSWISLLQASSLIYLLPPYHKNYGKRIIKAPKLYFMDTGLVSYLVGLQTAEHLMNSPMAGALFETAIVSNFKKSIDSLLSIDCLYYWRSISGLEIDLLVDVAGKLYPIEIKLASTIRPEHFSGLEAWQKLSKSKTEGLVISQSDSMGPIGSHTSNCHWSCL